ncbi:hypothetical protein RJ641_021026 [Dillenia turbinata]|uniref:DUF7731 domain-containing protein n=1 Tax=Dillenia turbinata TaxID=194707 RepID=A0AAN8UDX7_9MAGN
MECQIYANCEEAYRLTQSGNVNVTSNATDAYSEGPCLTETHLLLTCIENILTNFEFYNKATIRDIRNTINAGCGHGSQQGNFNVTEHMQLSAESNGNQVAGGKVMYIRQKKQ